MYGKSPQIKSFKVQSNHQSRNYLSELRCDRILAKVKRQYRKKLTFNRSSVTHSHRLAVFSVKSKTSFLCRNNSMETPLTESSRFDVSPQGGRLYWKLRDSGYYSNIKLILVKGKVVPAYSREKL